VLGGVWLPDFLRFRLLSRLNCSSGPPGLEFAYDSGNAAKLTRLGVLRPLPLLDPPDPPPPKKLGMLSSEGEGDRPGEFLVGDKVGDRSEAGRKEDCRGGEGGLVDEECLFLVKSLVTDAVAWEVLVSGNAGGANSSGGGRNLEPEVELDTIKPSENPRRYQKRGHTHTTAKPRAASLAQ